MITIQGDNIRNILEQLGIGTPWVVKVEAKGEQLKVRIMLKDPKLENTLVVDSLHELADEIKRLAIEVDQIRESATVPSEK